MRDTKRHTIVWITTLQKASDERHPTSHQSPRHCMLLYAACTCRVVHSLPGDTLSRECRLLMGKLFNVTSPDRRCWRWRLTLSTTDRRTDRACCCCWVPDKVIISSLAYMGWLKRWAAAIAQRKTASMQSVHPIRTDRQTESAVPW